MRKISLLLTTALILISSFTANAVLNMGGKTIFTGTLIEVLEPTTATQIQSIITNITDASVDKPYLIHLGPGKYDLGSTGIVMKEFVSIQGSGQKATKIIGEVSTGSVSAASAIVSGANDATLMDLTVENTGGGGTYSIAIYNSAASSLIQRVTATASGGSSANYGVFNFNSSTAQTMTNVTASASGGSASFGVYNQTSSPTMTNVTATASGGGNSYGVFNSSSAPFIQGSILNGNTAGLFMFSDSSGTRVVNSKIIGGVADGPNTTTNCRDTYKADLSDQAC